MESFAAFITIVSWAIGCVVALGLGILFFAMARWFNRH